MYGFGQHADRVTGVSLTLVPAAAGSFSITDRTVVVRLAGDLTRASRVTVRAHLLGLVEPGGPHDIVLDLWQVSSIDDAGVRPLLEAHRLQVGRGGGLHLGSVSRAVAMYLYAEPAIADVLMPQFAIDHPYSWVTEGRWFDTGVGSDEDGAS